MYTFILNDKQYTNFDDVSLAKLVTDEKITQAQANTVIAEALARIDATKAKRITETAVNGLTVDVDGLVFKANDKSIGRMVAAILDAQTTGDTSTIWKMADGSSQSITLEQLKTAQSLAIRAVGALVVG